jgi:diguanylate cyclase (GGDEF)-like protein
MRIRPHSLKLSLSLPAFEKTAPHLLKMTGEMMAANFQVAESVRADSLTESVAPDNGHSQSTVLCLPLIVEDKAVGVIKAIRHSGNFEKPDEQLLAEMSRIASIALNNAMRYEQAERMYMQDDLTQLYNSRYLRQFIDREIKRAHRYGSSFSVIFIDIDGFKDVNDRYGHRVGSETLCEAAHLLMESVRDTDVVARYGGDEFTIVLPETPAEQALLTAERIRQALAEQPFSGGGKNKFHLTASFGVAAFPEHAQNAADLLEKADLAMYEAKAVGKNKAKLSTDASESRVPVLT